MTSPSPQHAAAAEATVDTANLTRAEARRRAAILRTDAYDVVLDVAGPEDTFTSRTTIRFTATEEGVGASTFVDVQAASIESATLNGEPIDVAGYDGNRLAVPAIARDNELVIDAVMRYSRTGEGLHRFVDPVDDEVYLYSQFEVADARRMYANFEQPDLKATFTFTVTAPAHWLVLSNSPTPAPQDATERDGREIATWRFAPTDRISTYLTALVAGPYQGATGELTSSDGRTIPLGVYARASLAEHLDAEDVMETTRQGFAFYEQAFRTPYPFAKYDQIFVPDFNAGAMENVGCVTFRDSYVFRSNVPAATRERRVVTILHELAHMWFGDLVTMRWWNDLWLNESFAEFMSTLATAEATEHEDAWVTFTALEKAWAYRQDQLPSTHPIVAPIEDFEDVFVNFDGITYAKGASVLQQLVAYVGRDEFFRGLKAYFDAHAWANTELSDLLGELEAASGRDLTAWSKVWLEESGVTVLRPVVETDADGTVTRFTIEQTPRTGVESLRPHRLTVGVYSLEDGRGEGRAATAFTRTGSYELDVAGASTEVPELVGAPRPDLVLVNDGDLTYAKVRLDEHSLDVATTHIEKLGDTHARTLVLAAAWDMVRDGELAATTYLDIATRALPIEDQSTALRILLANIATSVNSYVDPDAREGVRADVAETLLELTRRAKPGSDAQLQLSRAFMLHASGDTQLAVVRRWLDGVQVPNGLVMDTAQRWLAVQALAAADVADDAMIADERERDSSYQGELEAATARAARPTPEGKGAAYEALTTDETLSNSMVEHLLLGFARTRDVPVMEPFAEQYFGLLDTVWQQRPGEMARNLVAGLFPQWLAGQEPGTDVEVVERAQAWLDAHPQAPSGQRRLLAEAISTAERTARAQQVDAEHRAATFEA